AAPAVGTYLVQRRLALLGDGIGHIAVTGVALGLLTGWAPIWTAVGVAVVGALLIELIRARGRTSGDVALALLFYGGIAGGVLLSGLADGGPATLHQYLFGSISTVSGDDIVAVAVLAVVVIGLAVGLSPQLFAVCQDEEFAQVQGLRVQAYTVAMSVMAAVTVTVAMRTVGLLLVSALMVVPVATAQQVTRGFRTTLLAAMLLGTLASLAGVTTSFYADVAPGATIVLLALAGFAATWPIGTLIRRRQHLTAPFEQELVDVVPEDHTATETHPHVHDEHCGHPAVLHGDHVDYVHDGHRHAAHGDHYDEH
ncbi:MAG: iron chelate uptake ABC transporter family permease subunit, partial [Propionibacteriales bacterium]|nr:iron chelate uptake ABC transporter family permease subunit [Propionibacteriales bacterium]